MTQIYKIQNNIIDNNAIKEVILNYASNPNLSSSWKFEIYYNKKEQTINVSVPISKNSWTEDPEKIGEFDFIDFSDYEGIKCIYSQNKEYTGFLEFQEGDFNAEDYTLLDLKIGLQNLEKFYYYDGPVMPTFEYINSKNYPIVMNEKDFIEYSVINEDWEELDNIIDKIEVN